MNTEQVVEMIDAITEGKPYALTSKKLTVALGSEEVGFFIGARRMFFDDPRTAREIAAALVAWANRKDGMVNWDVAKSATIHGRDLRNVVQNEFERLHRILHETPDIPENKDKLIELQMKIQILREQGAKDFGTDV